MTKYKALEKSVVEGTAKYKRVEKKASEQGYRSIIESGQGAMVPNAPQPRGQNMDQFDRNNGSAVSGALEGLHEVGKNSNDLLKGVKAALPAASMIGTAIGGAGGTGVAGVANDILGGIKSANAVTTIPELPLLPIAFEGLKTAADVGQTAFQAAHRNDNPLANASRERQGLTDMRQMFAAQKAMLAAERDKEGDDPQGRASEREVRRRRMWRAAGRMVLANQKLVKAQAKTGITSLNEYTGQQSNFIAKGKVEDEGPLLISRLAKRFGRRREAPPDQDPIAVDEQPRPQGEDPIANNVRESTTEIERVPDDNADDEGAEGRERFSTEVRRVPDDNADDEA